MRNYLLVLSIILFFSFEGFTQTYILNEDFSTASSNNPPVGWINNTISGEVQDVWRFDNPGSRIINFPVNGVFAIFDSEWYSQDGVSENVALQSPSMDCSVSNNIFLFFDHFFAASSGAQGFVEVFNGNEWIEVMIYTDSTQNSSSEMINISTIAGGVTNASVRFRFSANDALFWAIDNIRIYAPLASDAGVTAITNPSVPLTAGVHNIIVNLKNFGAETLNDVDIQWSVNDTIQPVYNWSGALPFDSSLTGIVIGSYSFPAGATRRIKVWTENPNGGIDLNAYNDTVSKYVYSELCGTYTIGGITPDFIEIEDAVNAMEGSGINCPIVFKIRDGIYNEQIHIEDIPGNSSINTITFESESGDSSQVVIKNSVSDPINDYTVKLENPDFVVFKGLSIQRENGDTAFVITGNSHDITIQNCIIDKATYSPVTTCNNRLRIDQNVLEDVFIYAPDSAKADSVIITNNYYHQSKYRSIQQLNLFDNNVFHSESSNNILYGVKIENCDTVLLFRNNVELINSMSTNICSGPYHVHALMTSNNSFINLEANYFYAFRYRQGTAYGFLSENDSIIFSYGNYYSPNSEHCAPKRGVEINGAYDINLTADTLDSNYEYNCDGIRISSPIHSAVIDSCNIQSIYSTGIYLNNNLGAICDITNNRLVHLNDRGMYIEGDSVYISNNEIQNFRRYEGIFLNANNSYCGNNIINDLNGYGTYSGNPHPTGIAVLSDSNVIENNRIFDGDFLSYILNIQGDYNTISNNQFSDINIFETTYAFNVSGDYNTIQRDSCIELIGEGYYLSGTGNVINASKLLKQSEGVGVLLEGKQSRVTNNFFSLEGLGNAIGVQINEGSDSSLVAFNSVMVNSSDEMNGIALKLEGGDSVQVVNNIFSNNGQGYAGYFALDDLSAYTLDHNVYYSFNEKVGYFNALNYTSFSDLQSAINQETYSAYYNPFYVSVSDLTPTQGLIDNMGMVIPGIDADIDFVMRDAVTPDVGAIEFEGSPCDPNAGLLQFVEITNPLPTGLLDVKVSHINFGNAALIKDTIRWEVNGVSQTPYVWAGNLANAESDTVTIGSILIESGNLYSFKAWTDFPNDIEDCAPQNDTIWKNNLGTELCGTYTVGWDTADFVNMAEVQAALNGGGVGCDVTFILKDTVFYEQFRLGNIVGNADTATITFQSYSLDSNSCELRYTPSNPTNDFVVKLDGADYVTFKGIKFYRNTSTSSSISYEAIRINNESHNILFDRCWIVDDVISEPNSVDSCITFRKCNIDNGSISIRNPIGIYGKQYLIDSSNVDNDIVVDQASSLTVKGSSFRRLIADTITDVLVQNSTSYYTGSSIYPMFSVLDLAVCNNITVSNNNFYSQPYYYNAQSIFLDKCSNVLIDSNSIYCRARRQNAAIGIYANQNENIQILNNRIRVDGIVDYDDYPNQIGIQILDSDSIIIRKDSIFCINPEEQGHGIYLRDNTGFVQVDSSYIYGMRDHGLYIEVGSDSTMITSNHIDSCGLIGLRVAQGLNGVFNNNQITRIQRDNQFSTGILVEGLKAKFYDNYLYEIHGTGMEIQGDSTKVFANQILRIEDGAGLIINSKYDSVYNNWIACYGAGSSKGVFIDSLSASSQILHNSIHNVSSNINSQSLCIKSSANNTIKNNIFSNTGQGYSVYSGVIDMSNLDMDYNSYYSLDNKLGYFQNNLLTSLNAWQQSTGLDAHSQGVNPFFTSNTDLSFNQGLINDAADPVIWIDEDIFHSARSVTPDIGAMECDASACTPNAGLNDFVNIINPLSEGLTSIVVELSNQAATVLDSVQIEWSINGMSQAPFYWYGSLSYNEVDTVTIGSYNFVSGDLYDIKAWVDLPNGIEDCNHLNDTIQMNDLGTTLCGVYTIGGLDADFINFDAAEYILMTAGISCDVTFMVRDGVYHNQLFLSDISGMTDTNRIQFVGESQDSSAVEILYYLNDDDNDYTVMLDHSMNISFENIFINRLQGDTSVVIKGSGKNLSFENCMIKEKFISYANSNDSLIRMVNCNLEELVCFSKVDSLSILNSQMPMLIIDSVTNYQLIGNTIDNSSSLDTEAGIISNSSNGNIEGNYFSAVATNYDWAKALQLNNDSIISCIDNTVYASGHDDFSYSVVADNCKEFLLIQNSIQAAGNSARYAVLVESVDNPIISNNTVTCSATDKNGVAIEVNDCSGSVIIDSNIIYTSQNGIRTNNAPNSLSISYNEVYNTSATAIQIDGIHGDINENYIHDVEGEAIRLRADSTNLFLNRIIDNANTVGITVEGQDNLIANNSIHIGGTGLGIGFNILSGADRTKIVFNSVNITSIDPLNGTPLKVEGGNEFTIKNNIFSNGGGGLAVYLDTIVNGSLWDYNDHYSSSGTVGYFDGDTYYDINDWSMAIMGDANTISVNPYFVTDTEMRPYQRAINGAGIPIASVLLDFDNEIRNSSAPDIGVDEFTVDFGLVELLRPLGNCDLTGIDTISVKLRQFGDIPFEDIWVAYQVNGGDPVYELIGGSINNDIVYSFDSLYDFSTQGTYNIQVWIVAANDDNVSNDTLWDVRYNAPLPDLHPSFDFACYGSQTQFNANTSISMGSVDTFYWNFGDGDSSLVENPVHTYDTAGVYSVYYRAYSDLGCYSDTTIYDTILPLAVPDFSTNNICYTDTAFFTDHTIISDSTYFLEWDFGDGFTSQEYNPEHYYASPDTFIVKLTAYNAQGCPDSIYGGIRVYSLPVVEILNLDDNYCADSQPVELMGSPVGGVFSGPFVTNDTLFINLLTPASEYEVTYTYFDGICSNVDTNMVYIDTIPDVFLLGLESQYCFTAIDDTLSSMPYGGIFTGPALTDSVFSPSILPAGSYELFYSFTDGNGCSNTDTVQTLISTSSMPVISVDSLQNVSCYGGDNGLIYISVSGGTPPYLLYEWSNGFTSEDISNLSSGEYSLTITDSEGCRMYDTISIVQPNAPITIDGISDSILCYEQLTGAIDVEVQGGTPAYSYLWSNGEINQDIEQIGAGIYSLTVTDANLCTSSFTHEVLEPNPIEIYFLKENLSCFGDQNGSIETYIVGGSAPYLNYQWSSGQFQPVINDIPAGVYIVTVTDSHGCVQKDSTELSSPNEIIISENHTDILCENGLDASIDVLIEGGVPNYEIHWSTGQTTESLYGIGTGVYSITVTDANACTSMESVEILQIVPSIIVNDSISDVSCFGAEDGEIKLDISGGAQPLSLLWSWNSSSDSILSGLSGGEYYLTVSDQNQCVKEYSYSINEPYALEIVTDIVNVSCRDKNDGEINLNVTGGTLPYVFSWSNGSEVQSLSSLSPGTYIIELQDVNFCTLIDTFIIDESNINCQQIPELFSPNGDGLNDVWLIGNVDLYPEISVKVFNRWGQMVFESEGYAEPWDGRYNGRELPMDAYYYVIILNEEYEPVTGIVSIVR